MQQSLRLELLPLELAPQQPGSGGKHQRPVAAWPAPQLHRPLLFLEHSEFTGLGYAETLAACRAATADSLPLRLYRLR